MSYLSPNTWPEILDVFELKAEDVILPHPAMGVNKAREMLEKVKQTFHEQRKRLAKKYHPDRGGDPERLKVINALMDKIDGWEIKIVPRPRPVVFYWSRGWGTSATNMSSTVHYYWTS
jgi:hypothetical protein